jgi:hypothetical protein
VELSTQDMIGSTKHIAAARLPQQQQHYSQRAGMVCDTCQRPYTPTACERMLVLIVCVRICVLVRASSLSFSLSRARSLSVSLSRFL